MKVSYNWLQQLVDFDLPPVDKLVEKIGAQLGGVEEVINLGERYQGIVVAKVVSCQPIEGSDHLSVCRIDDGKVVKDVERGDDGLVQVVCGAPNCREGLLVAWLPPGRTVPSSFDEDERFVLGARELRGHKSNGMLASPKELAIGDSHDGILELDPKDAKPGDDFAKTYGLAGEYIIDIENKMFTHRPDCFGLLGVAREVAGILDKQFTSPEWYNGTMSIVVNSKKTLKVEVRNEIPELVSRFAAIAIADVENGSSPVWLQVVLSRVGLRPINTVVDLTNYFMLLTGQPLHAYDYDKVVAQDKGADHAVLTVRLPKPGEKLQLLNGKQIEPRGEAILIANSTEAIGLGGVMGGENTEVDANTKNIILESANFDMYSIRRTSMAHGIFSDAVTRFNKGQSPLQNVAVLARTNELVLQLTGGRVASDAVDDIHVANETVKRQSLHPAIKLTTDFINVRLGSKLNASEIKKLLHNVECDVETKGDELTVSAPFWRTDIELREDIVEEVGRLYGYDNLKVQLPTRDIKPAERNALLDAKDEIREKLAKAGANEVLTYSFVHGDLLTKVSQDPAKAFQLSNALSPDLQYYRLSLLPSLLDKVHGNIKAGHDEFALFEIGKVHGVDHQDGDGLPTEHEFTALLVTAADKLHKSGAAYYQARYLLEYLVGPECLDFKPVSKDMQAYPVVQPYDLNRTALVSTKDGEFLGIIGEFKASVLRNLKLPKFTAGFEVDTTVLAKLLADRQAYKSLSRFPAVSQDITLKVAGDLSFGELSGFAKEALAKSAPENSHFDLHALDRYQADGDDKHLNISLRLTIASYDRTLTDNEVNSLLDEVAAAAKAKFGAERI